MPLKFLFPSFIFFFSSQSALADTFYVTDAAAIGDVVAEASASSELIRSAIPMAGKHKVVGQEGDAEFVLVPKVVRAGRSLVVSLSKKRKGEIIFSSQLKALSGDELDIIARRLAVSVINEVPVEEATTMGNVVENEQNRLERRTRAPGRWMLGLAPAGAAGLGKSGTWVTVAFGRSWQVSDWDAVRVMVDLGGATETGNQASFASAGLGATHAFSDDNIAPYLGAELGLGEFDNSAGKGQGNLSLTAVAGVELWRTSTVGMNVEARVRTMPVRIEGKIPLLAGLGLSIAY